MSQEDEQKGEVRHVCIFECYPQADDPQLDLYDEIPAADLTEYKNAEEIVRGFMGKLERKHYDVPSVKNARQHDLHNEPTIKALNRLATYDISDEESDTDSSDDDEMDFSDSARHLIQRYLYTNNSVDCFLLLVAYKYESDRFESEQRLMIVQLPFREDVFVPDEEDTEDLFQQIQDAFDNNLKKSGLYPYQEDAIPDPGDEDRETSDSSEESSEDSPKPDANVYLYQANGQAEYWRRFLRLEEERHEDEILVEQTVHIVKQYEDEDIDNEDIDDPLGNIEYFEYVDVEDPPEGVEDYLDSGVVIKMGDVTIRGFTVEDILAEDQIRFYKDQRTGEVVASIEGSDPSFFPIGKSKVQLDAKDDEPENKDLNIFHNVEEYNDIDQLGND